MNRPVRVLCALATLVVAASYAQGSVYTWFSFQNHDYALTITYGTWTQCRSEALGLGGDLVAINSAAEQVFLSNQFGVDEDLFIGYDGAVSNVSWSNGDPVTYTNWAGGQPDGAFGGYKGFLNFTPGKWDDVPDYGWPSPGGNFRGIIEVAHAVPLPSALLGSLGLFGALALRRICRRGRSA
jgi:hypothetical protein